MLALVVGGITVGLSSEGVGMLRFLIVLNLILLLALLLYLLPARLLPEGTRNILQMGYLMLGGLMVLSGVLGMFNEGFKATIIFLTMLALPGAALLWTGATFKSKKSKSNE